MIPKPRMMENIKEVDFTVIDRFFTRKTDVFPCGG